MFKRMWEVKLYLGHEELLDMVQREVDDDGVVLVDLHADGSVQFLLLKLEKSINFQFNKKFTLAYSMIVG